MFRRAPQPPSDVTHLIVGLGNPGREYARTRHNVGFQVVDALARQHEVRFAHRWSDALVGTGSIAGRSVALAKPQTYMNASGESVRGLLRRLNLKPDALLVVCDDIDRPVGKLRLRERGSAGGHRGVQSIVERLATNEFARLRIGVGRPDPREAADYVLGQFAFEEKEAIDGAIGRAAQAVECWLGEGIVSAMNGFNS